MSRGRIVFLLLLGLASPLQAQFTALRSGDEVRVGSPSARGRFTVQEAAADALVLRDSAGATLALPYATISSLSVSRGRRSPGRGALRGAGIGLAVGAGFGTILGFAVGDNSADAFFSRGEAAMLGAITIGGAGAVLGAVIGVAAPGERWERVLPAGVRAGITPGGGVAIHYGFRF